MTFIETFIKFNLQLKYVLNMIVNVTYINGFSRLLTVYLNI